MIESEYLRRAAVQIVHKAFDGSIGERRLQSSSSSTYTNGTSSNSGDGSGSDRYEFVAFLLWYIFLVLCCVVPTCCAYHRRRMMEQRLALHRNTMRHNSNSLFFLSGLQQQSANRPRNTEHVQQERLGILREELKGTTMTIKAEHIVIPPKLNDNPDSSLQQSSADESAAAAALVEVDLENCDAMDDAGQIIQLPSIGVNTDRAVAGVCTICLCPYEDGDQISWSTEASCQHAFHTDCIIPWLAKKEEPRCPICRQEFCPTPIVSQVEDAAFDIDLERENSFLHSFSQALAMSQLYRPYPSESANTYEQTRNAITLQLATLALENQVRLEQQTASTVPTVNASSVPPHSGSSILSSAASDPSRNSGRTVGDENNADLETAPATSLPSENTVSINVDTTNNNNNSGSDVPPVP